MGKNLCVVIGAGASFDLIGAPTALVNSDYQPPLAAGIFQFRLVFQAILDQYPDARAIAATVGIRLRRGETLERILRDLRDTNEPHIQRQYRQVPLYLQHLFALISKNFTSEPINYTYLLNRVLCSDFDNVVLLTTNYDLFLEAALRPVAAWHPNTMDSYVKGDKFQLVKLHGSVNWARRITAPSNGEVSDSAYLRFVSGIDLDHDLDSEYILVNRFDQRWLSRKDGRALPLYPAIAVPVEGKYEYVCPAQHIDEARERLSKCTACLFIGTSGNDEDVLDLVASGMKECRDLCIVGGQDVRDVAVRLTERVQVLRSAIGSVCDVGFSQFLQEGRLERFLDNLSWH